MKNARRSASEMLAVSEANTVRLKARAALETAKADPALSAVMDSIDSMDTLLRECSKLNGTGPGGIRTRRKSHDLWITLLNAETERSAIQDDYAHAVKSGLQKLLVTLTTKIAKGGKVTAKETASQVRKIVDSFDDGPLMAIRKVENSAETARKSWTAHKKLSKKALASG